MVINKQLLLRSLYFSCLQYYIVQKTDNSELSDSFLKGKKKIAHKKKIMQLIKIFFLSIATVAVSHAFQPSLHRVSLVKNAHAIGSSFKVSNQMSRSLMKREKMLYSTIVKAAEDSQVTSEKKKGFLDNIWNDNTKIVAYLTVWYLGNIFCT